MVRKTNNITNFNILSSGKTRRKKELSKSRNGECFCEEKQSKWLFSRFHFVDYVLADHVRGIDITISHRWYISIETNKDYNHQISILFSDMLCGLVTFENIKSFSLECTLVDRSLVERHFKKERIRFFFDSIFLWWRFWPMEFFRCLYMNQRKRSFVIID